MEDSASKVKGLAWLVSGCLLGVLFAFGLSPLAYAIPWSWENKLGYMLDSGAAPRCPANPQAETLLQKLVKRLYPVNPDDGAFSIDVQIVRNPLVNAYAELGGKISVNSGLLKQAESPEEVAGVLAHEIEHVHHRHILQGVIAHALTVQGLSMIFTGDPSSADWAGYFLNMSFTRTQEAQADEDGLRRLQKAHVDNGGFRRFFERMEKSESAATFLSDHPASSDRMAMVASFDNRGATPIMTAEEWKMLKGYCGEK